MVLKEKILVLLMLFWFGKAFYFSPVLFEKVLPNDFKSWNLFLSVEHFKTSKHVFVMKARFS